jgi:MMP 1-O-methyltransferase
VRSSLKGLVRRILGDRTARRLAFLVRNGPRGFHLLHFAEIDGWLSDREGLALYDLAAALAEPAPVAVEIGSWLGKSSYAIARGLRGHPAAVLYCIDPFNAPTEDERTRRDDLARQGRCESSLRETFWANMVRYGVAPTARVLEGYSHDVVRQFTERIDLLFIDGAHAYDAVARDVADWAPLVKPGGMIALHDVRAGGRHAGPWRVAHERLTAAAGWRYERHVDSLWVARKDRNPSRA